MELIKVKSSSSVEGYAYDKKKHQLYVRFQGGKMYRYKDVPVLVWKGLEQAESKGSFIQQWVVKGPFRYEAVKDAV